MILEKSKSDLKMKDLVESLLDSLKGTSSSKVNQEVEKPSGIPNAVKGIPALTNGLQNTV